MFLLGNIGALKCLFFMGFLSGNHVSIYGIVFVREEFFLFRSPKFDLSRRVV
jgi:hypothetical protein